MLVFHLLNYFCFSGDLNVALLCSENRKSAAAIKDAVSTLPFTLQTGVKRILHERDL